MSDPERPETPRARSLHVAHIGPATPAGTATRIGALLARADATANQLQVVVIAPDASDAVAIARELRALTAGESLRVVPLASPRRSRRLVADAVPHVVVGTAGVLAELMRASALPAAAVTGIAIVDATELEPDASSVDVLLGELGKGAAKVLTAAVVTPFVEQLLAAHLHGARRLMPATDAPASPAAAVPAVEVQIATAAALPQALADVLERVDAPSAVIVPADARHDAIARDALAELGYPPESPVARVSRDGTTHGAALVCCLGAPSTDQWTAITAGAPVRIVALTTVRERIALAALPGASVVPLANPAAAAVAAEEAMRERVRRTLRNGLPAREMLALEPLLAEHDALAVAAALLRLLERDNAARTEAARATPVAAPPPRSHEARREPSRGPGGDRVGSRGRDDERRGPPRGRDGERRGPPRGRDAERAGPPRGRDRDDDRRGPPRARDGERRGPPRGYDSDRRGPPRGRDGERRGPPRGRDGDRPSRSRPPFRKPE